MESTNRNQPKISVVVFCTLLLCIVTLNTNLGAQNGVTANQGSAIGSLTSGIDYLWADTAGLRWKVSNNGVAAQALGIWACPTQLGGLVYSGTAPTGSDTNAEMCLSLGTTVGVPLLAGTSAPQWGGSIVSNASSVSLDLQGWAAATEVLNETGTGTVVNTLAKITSTSTTGAIQATTSDTTIPTYIVVGGAGKTGNAQLAFAGQAYCKMDATNGAGVEGQPVFASNMTAGDCTTSTTVPLGAWVVGQMISNTTTATSNSIILVRPGFRALPSSFLGTGTNLVLATTLSNSSGTELATATGTLTNTHLAKFNSSGDIADSGVALASVSGNTTIAATANSNLTSSASGHVVSVDANGNVQDGGAPLRNALIVATCGGAVGTSNATAYFFYPSQTATASCTASNTTNNLELIMPFSCTAQNLFCQAQTGGVSASKIVLYKNGSASALSCPLGTGTSASDTTHTVSFNGSTDTWSIRAVTGQASDPMNNLRASFQCQ